MNATRRAGLALAAVATALWLGFGASVLTASPEDGANIGAGLMALLAIPLSVGASVTLLLSLRSDRRSTPGTGRGGSPGRPGLRWAAALLAVVPLVALPGFLLIDPYAVALNVQLAMLGIGAAGLVASALLFALLSRRRS